MKMPYCTVEFGETQALFPLMILSTLVEKLLNKLRAVIRRTITSSLSDRDLTHTRTKSNDGLDDENGMSDSDNSEYINDEGSATTMLMWHEGNFWQLHSGRFLSHVGFHQRNARKLTSNIAIRARWNGYRQGQRGILVH